MGRVLVACEFTGTVRDAFLAEGHDAWSCDLLPSADGSNRHIVGDARSILDQGWDLLMVAHPPCTRLCNSGVRWLHEPPGRLTRDDYTLQEIVAYQKMTRDERLAFMWQKLDEGAALFSDFWRAPIARVCVENPVMHPHAKARMPSDLARPQIVQPWWFGEPALKATGLYLRGLPPLAETTRLTPPCPGTDEYKRWSAVHLAAPGPARWRERSRFFPGIARAMARQWGSLLPETSWGATA